MRNSVEQLEIIESKPSIKVINGSKSSRAKLFSSIIEQDLKQGKEKIEIDLIGLRQMTMIDAVRKNLEWGRNKSKFSISIKGILYAIGSIAIREREYFEHERDADFLNRNVRDAIVGWQQLKKEHPEKLLVELRFTQIPLLSYVRINDTIVSMSYTLGESSKRPAVISNRLDELEFYEDFTEYFEKAFSDQSPFIFKMEQMESRIKGSLEGGISYFDNIVEL